MRMSAEKQKNAGPVSSLIKSSLITSVIAIGLIVLTAVLMQQGVLDENGTQVAVTVVKVLCSVIAAMIAVKNISSRRWLVGALAGVYDVRVCRVFSAVGNVLHNDCAAYRYCYGRIFGYACSYGAQSFSKIMRYKT